MQPPCGLTLLIRTYTIHPVPSLTNKNLPAASKPEWEKLAWQLKHWGLSPFAASLLETAGPFSLLAAQSLYVAEPLLTSWMPKNSLQILAGLLEDPAQGAAFALTLREGE